MRISDWSSDVCSSDLAAVGAGGDQVVVGVAEGPGRAAVADARGRGHRDRAGAGVGQRRMRHRSARDAAQGIHGRLDRLEEHTSEPQSILRFSYAVFWLKIKTPNLNVS